MELLVINVMIHVELYLKGTVESQFDSSVMAQRPESLIVSG